MGDVMTYQMKFTEYQRQLLWWAMHEFSKEMNLERKDLAQEYKAIMQQLTGKTA